MNPIFRTATLLLPAIIPSWRFFKEVGPSPRIEIAPLDNADATPTAWRPFRPRPATLSFGATLSRMIWNPQWNESLYLVTCAERLIADEDDHSRREIASRMRFALAQTSDAQSHFQFRIVFVARGADGLTREIAYVSPVEPTST